MPKRRRRLSTEELFLQPWFLPKRIAKAVTTLLPQDYRSRLQDYFEDYGCMRCGRTDKPYKSNGMCKECVLLVFRRVYISERRRQKDGLPKGYGKDFMAKAQQAQRLLKGLARFAGVAPKRPRIKSAELASPVIETFDRYEIE